MTASQHSGREDRHCGEPGSMQVDGDQLFAIFHHFPESCLFVEVVVVVVDVRHEEPWESVKMNTYKMAGEERGEVRGGCQYLDCVLTCADSALRQIS